MWHALGVYRKVTAYVQGLQCDADVAPFTHAAMEGRVGGCQNSCLSLHEAEEAGHNACMQGFHIIIKARLELSYEQRPASVLWEVGSVCAHWRQPLHLAHCIAIDPTRWEGRHTEQVPLGSTS